VNPQIHFYARKGGKLLPPQLFWGGGKGRKRGEEKKTRCFAVIFQADGLGLFCKKDKKRPTKKEKKKRGGGKGWKSLTGKIHADIK